MRAELSNFLVERALADPNFVVLSGDHGYALFDALREKAPKQFLNVGVSEQAMIGYAAGLAKSGFKVVVYGLAAFVPTRVFEFIKMDVCYDRLPIIFLGDGAGLVYNTLGASHQCAEDIAVMRTLPNMEIYSPADRFELRQCMESAFHSSDASYVRIGKSDKKEVHSSLNNRYLAPIKVRDAQTEVVFIATGSMVSTALEVADRINCSVISVPKITNIAPSDLLSTIGNCSKIVTLEEHSINGGLGSAVSEIIAEGASNGKRICRLGIQNRFTEKCGSYEYAISEHKLDHNSIIEQLAKREFIQTH